MRTTMKRLATAALASAALAGPLAAAAVESKDPIKLTIHDWTGQYITTNIMGAVLEEMGYNVEYVQADYIAQFAGLEAGDLHVAMEMWETTGKDAMEASLATGKTVDLGETGMVAIEEWWYPMYMKEKCPGLPDWEALNGCAEAFSTPETHPKGRYLGGPVTWGGYDDERADALGLDYESCTPAPTRRSSPSSSPRSSARRRSCSGSTRRTGRPSSTRASGSTSHATPTSATRIRPGA